MAKFEDFQPKELIPLMLEDWWWDSKCECGERKNPAYRNKEGEPKRNRYCYECSQKKRAAEGGDNTYKGDIPDKVNVDEILDF